MYNKITAKANTNIALIKYWGKKNQDLIIPMNNSLSLTLDHFYTKTQVLFKKSLTSDIFLINDKIIKDDKLSNFMNIIRYKAKIKDYAIVKSFNHVPISAGLASSSSAYAALAAAASKAAGMNLSRKDLSKLARRGSGSACRSIYGGFVEWVKGYNDNTSYSYPIDENTNWKICMIIILINTNKKKISSRIGMQRVVNTSPYYKAWVNSTAKDLKQIKKAIKQRDFEMLGKITESNTLKMHALNLSAQPHFSYFEPLSVKLLKIIENIREKYHLSCYYTLDAGPNIKILCENKNAITIKNIIKSKIPELKLIISHPGDGVKFI